MDTHLIERTQSAANQTVDYLLHNQLPDGRWVGELSSSCEPTSCAIISMHIANQKKYAERVERGIAWLLDTQHLDGGWGDAISDPSNINATSLAVSALHLIDRNRHNKTIGRALKWLKKMGDWEAVCDMNRCSLSGVCRTIAALVGLIPWSRLKDLPFEVILAPKGVRRKISITLPAFLALAMMQDKYRSSAIWRKPLRILARRKAVDWLRQTQASNGSYEESALLNALVVIGLTAGGITEASDIIQASLDYIVKYQRKDGSWPIDRDLETSNTHNSILGLQAYGFDLQQPRFERTKEWLLATQFRDPFFATGAPGGGWSWAVPGGWPDVDDSSYNVKTLMAFGLSPKHAQLQQGIDYLLKMQNKNGSWSTFVPDSNLPYDQPCPYVTSHVLSGLWSTGLFTINSKPIRRAMKWLRTQQKSDGAFSGIWFRNYTCATAFILEVMSEYGLTDDSMARRCLDWLLENQNTDGSWGGRKGDEGTPEETSWAVTAMMLAGVPVTDHTIQQAIVWLVDEQRADGTWNPSNIGLYFRSLWYSDSYYAIAFPLKALAIFLNLVRSAR
jgi:squalene-hopene/tetraprenyl-beta-curcumene cyclase